MDDKTLTEKYKDAHSWISFEERRIQEDILDLKNKYNQSTLTEMNADILGNLFVRIRLAQMSFQEDKKYILNKLKG